MSEHIGPGTMLSHHDTKNAYQVRGPNVGDRGMVKTCGLACHDEAARSVA